MKTKKLIIPAMAIALAFGLTACGPQKGDNSSAASSQTEAESSAQSGQESGQGTEEGKGNSSASSTQIGSNQNYKYKVATDEPKDFTIELLNKDAIRCNVSAPISTQKVSLMNAEKFAEYQAQYPALDVSFKFDNYETWEKCISNGYYPAIYIKKKGEAFEPGKFSEILKTIMIEPSDENGNVESPILTDLEYRDVQDYFDTNGPGEYELRVYVRDESSSKFSYHLQSVIPFTVKDVNE